MLEQLPSMSARPSTLSDQAAALDVLADYLRTMPLDAVLPDAGGLCVAAAASLRDAERRLHVGPWAR